MRAILMRSRFKDSCTELELSTIIGWVCLFGLSSVFGIVLFLIGSADDNGLGVLTSFCTPWGGVGYNTITLWDGLGGSTDGTGTLWTCTGREICCRVGVGVTSGWTIVFFCVVHLRSSATLTSAFLALSPYYSDGTTENVLWKMSRMYVAEWLR